MVKFEGCKIPAVAANLTFGALALDQYFLPSSTPLLLRNIGLVAIIGIGVFAAPGAKLPLSTTKICAANNASIHQVIVDNPTIAAPIKINGI